MNLLRTPYVDLLQTYLRTQKLATAALSLLLVVGIGLQLLSPQLISAFIDAATTGATQAALIAIGVAFLFVVLTQRGLAVATTYVSQRVAWIATNELRRDLLRHVLALDLSFHNSHTPGELLERIDGDVDRLANYFSQFILQIVGGLLLTAGVLALLYREDWRLGAIFTVFVVVYWVVHYRGQQMATPYWRQERQSSADLVSFVEERVAGVADIQTSGAIAYTMNRFYALLRQRFWQVLKADVVTDIGWSISKIVYDLGTVAAMAVGAIFFQRGLITIGTVYLLIQYLNMLNDPLNRIARQMEDLQRVKVAVERTHALAQAPSAVADGTREMPGNAGPLSVEVAGVSFRYGQGALTLNDVSFSLAPGQVMGLLGRTGSGKTTLSRLLFRFHDASAGSIMLDGVDVRDLRLSSLRNQVALVTQDVQILRTSVRNNLTLFSPEISDARLLEALQNLGMEPWLAGLPNGLDTQLDGEDGGLSAGEAQLLALARTLLKDPRLVILDEASSRLDPATERMLDQAIRGLLRNRTAIVIAHRLATVQRADQILILEDGRVIESGPADRLAGETDSVYARLLRTGFEEMLT